MKYISAIDEVIKKNKFIHDNFHKEYSDPIQKHFEQSRKSVFPSTLAEKMFPVAGDKMPPTLAEKMFPVAGDKVPPTLAEKMFPVVDDKLSFTLAEKMFPVVDDKVSSTLAEKLFPVIDDKISSDLTKQRAIIEKFNADFNHLFANLPDSIVNQLENTNWRNINFTDDDFEEAYNIYESESVK